MRRLLSHVSVLRKLSGAFEPELGAQDGHGESRRGRGAFDPQTSLKIAFTFGVTLLPKWANFIRPYGSKGDGRIGSNAISDNSP